MRSIEHGEIWIVDFSPTIGREQSGIRPALVLSVNQFNKSMANKVVAIPVTSKDKGIPLDVQIKPS